MRVTVGDVASLALTIGEAAVCVIEGAVDFMLVLNQDVLADDLREVAVGERKRQVGEVMQRLNVVSRSDDAPVRTLSGGNQQKTILARWLLRDLDVIVFIEPTRGVDVGSKAEIYHDLETLAGRGKAIVVVSSDVPEIVGIADRVLVMVHGRIGRTIAREKLDEETVNLAVQGAG